MCQRCGLSCMGVAVRPTPEERPRLEARADALGVRYPFEGDRLRLVMGRCVFYEDGCRLHAAYGAEAKPQVCRQFPFVRRGREVGVDPACAHWTGFVAPGPDGLLGVDEAGDRTRARAFDGLDDAGERGPSLEALGGQLALTLGAIAERWREIPWALWMDSGASGPLRRAAAERLAALPAPAGWPDWPSGARAVLAVARLDLGDPEVALVGATVVAAGTVDEADRRHLLACWLRGTR